MTTQTPGAGSQSLRMSNGTSDARQAAHGPASHPARPGFVRTDQSPPPALPHGCRCGARWSGSRTTHCGAAGCHKTLSGVTAFDLHRRNGQCLDPASIGMSLLAGRPYECWGYPTEDGSRD